MHQGDALVGIYDPYLKDARTVSRVQSERKIAVLNFLSVEQSIRKVRLIDPGLRMGELIIATICGA